MLTAKDFAVNADGQREPKPQPSRWQKDGRRGITCTIQHWWQLKNLIPFRTTRAPIHRPNASIDFNPLVGKSSYRPHRRQRQGIIIIYEPQRGGVCGYVCVLRLKVGHASMKRAKHRSLDCWCSSLQCPLHRSHCGWNIWPTVQHNKSSVVYF